MWRKVLKRDLLGETSEEDRFHNRTQLDEYIKSEIERQGENVVIRILDVALVDDLSGLFFGVASNVKTLDLSGWKTFNVKNMSDMFLLCRGLKSLNLSGWDTSNVVDMGWMFRWCESLESLDLSGWDTSNVEDMNGMFRWCENLKSLDLSSWDTSYVKNMSDMFSSCPAPYKVVDDNKIVKK